MSLIALIRREVAVKPLRFLVLATLSGLSSAGVLAVINGAAQAVASGRPSLRLLILFGLAIAIFVVSQRALMTDICRLVEQAIHRVRVRLVARAGEAELIEIERIGRADIYGCLSRETQTITQAAPAMVIAAQSAVLVVCTMLYIAALSRVAFALALAFTAAGAFVHRLRGAEIGQRLREAHRRENDFVERLSDMLDGFKEVKMSAPRARDIAAGLARTSSDATALKTATQILQAGDFVLSQVTFFLLTGMMVFVVPNISPTYVDAVVMTTTATLFLIGPISNVVGSIPIFANADAAADAILALEARMAQVGQDVATDPPPFLYFRRIQAEGLVFRHPARDGEEGFQVGPIDLTIERGSTVFVTGGNGSGKTTMMLTLLGLYPPQGGQLRLDHVPIGPGNVVAYRNLFAAVFSNNHLFRELYGIETIDPGRAAELFALLEVTHKTELRGRAFRTVQLSGGQRKRLAMMAAILERRPIFFFDEWAADQDPQFRRKFYREILPWLKQEGATIIAITHDDLYFDAADMHIHMEDGKISVPNKRRRRGASAKT